ncbi:MAG: CopD family protein [Minicystis sp.]
MELALTWLHVSGNVVWIGAILAVAVVILSAAAAPKVRGEIALGIYKRLAVPAFVVSFVCGAARLGLDPAYYLRQHHWMHAKLPLAIAVIAIHHVIGGRAKKLAQGTVQDAGPTAILAIVLAVSAVGAAFFAIFHLPN